MNTFSILIVAILACISLSFASIETETKYTLITQPGDTNTPLSKIDGDEDDSTTVITQDDSNSGVSEGNLEDDVSINILNNDNNDGSSQDDTKITSDEKESKDAKDLKVSVDNTINEGSSEMETENDIDSKVVKKKKKSPKAPIISHGPSNITAYYGDRIELLCKTEGRPRPKISWASRRIGDMPKVGPSYRVHKNGSLIFRRVEKQHESTYTCTAKNAEGSVKSQPARVTVEAKVQIVQYPEVVREVPGTPKDIQCTATGDPPPIIQWLKDGTPLPLEAWKSEIFEGVEYKPFNQYSRSVLRIKVSETANYTCYAMNQMIGGRQSADTKSFMVYVKTKDGGNKDGNEKKNNQPATSKGYCAPYNGQVCKKYLQGRGLVWFNISKDNSGGWVNEQITQSLWSEMITKLHEPCRSAAEALLCKYAFPDCVLNEGVAVGLPLCQQDCIALRNHFCYKDWAMIEDNKRRGSFVGSRGHFRLPKCDALPNYDNSTTASKSCTRSSITAMRWDLATTNCVKGSGRYYHGHVNKTQSSLPCATWFSKEPHEQSSPPKDIFPEMVNSANHCRNPGGTESSPWCYTTDSSVRWQYCDIPKCENLTAEHVNYAVEVEVFGGSSQDFMQEMMSPTFIVLASCIAFATLVVVLLLGLICNRICRSKAQNSGYTPANCQDNAIDLDKLPQNANYHHSGAQLNPKLEQLEYPRNDIIYIRDVGQGAFGRVFQAKAPNLIASEEFTMVAVKMLKEDATEDVLKDFEREACMLSEFDHPHIVRLLGVCAIGRPMCLLFEYMSRGDLSVYLRACSPNSYLTEHHAEKSSIAANTTASSGGGISCNGFGGDVKIGHIEQVQIAKQVCSGMVYLSDRKFVHRDLASRNCLLDASGSCKIADFGLSQRVFSHHGGNAYYRGDEEDAIPIRWMPPEAVLQNKYTVESDVWAFGVLLWEIFSMALQPYYGLSHEEVVKYVKSGKVLQCPENTPKSMYNVMVKCWNLRPSERPAFRSIHRELETIGRELILIQKHYRSQKSILSESFAGGRMTPQSPSKSSYA